MSSAASVVKIFHELYQQLTKKHCAPLLALDLFKVTIVRRVYVKNLDRYKII